MKDWQLFLMFGILIYIGLTLILAPYEVVRFLAPVFEFFGY